MLAAEGGDGSSSSTGNNRIWTLAPKDATLSVSLFIGISSECKVWQHLYSMEIPKILRGRENSACAPLIFNHLTGGKVHELIDVWN
jgi:hypothetical protein